MRIVALESSAVAASACVMEDDKLLGEFYINTRQTHSQTLLPMVQAVMADTGTSIGQVDCLAVSAGPGSFTGVRIGVASVKGLAFPHDIPCCGVSTLEAMAMNLRQSDCLICAVMDARCAQVYNALFAAGSGKLERLTEDCALSIAQLAEELPAWMEKLQKPLILVGDGAGVCAASPDFAGIEKTVAPPHLVMQRASGVAEAARRMVAEGKTVSAAQLAPVYLRMPQAERELKKRLSAQKPE